MDKSARERCDPWYEKTFKPFDQPEIEDRINNVLPNSRITPKPWTLKYAKEMIGQEHWLEVEKSLKDALKKTK